MTVHTIDTSTVKQNIDLRDYAAAYTTLRHESAQELSGPCPKCGGRDRFHVKADWWHCRQCYPPDNGKSHDVYAFVQWLEGCSFPEAHVRLTNAPLPTPITRQSSASKPKAEQPEAWQRKAAAIIERAHERLLDDADQEAAAGRNYLENERGLGSHTWLAFKLGYAPSVAIPGTEGKERAPAIVIPWYRSGKLVAIRYRFLQVHNGDKQTALSGSSFSGILFGGQALDSGIVELSTLLICEGELNCCSIWQAAQDTHLDVLSLGSESATITPAMVEHANKYARVMCWLDKEERARAVMTALPGAHGIKSPNGQDANDLLKAGMLGGFLAMHRFQAARNPQEQERLLWDLVDAARLWNGVDAGTAEMISHIAKTLGKPVQLSETRPGVWRVLDTVQHIEIAPAAERPALPTELWRQGIEDFTQAWVTWQELRQDYTAALGKGADGFYIRNQEVSAV